MLRKVNELQKLVKILDEDKRDLYMALRQCVRPRHLYIRARRTVVQAARVVVVAWSEGCFDILQSGWWILPWLWHPADECNLLPVLRIGQRRLSPMWLQIGNGCDTNGTLRDNTAFELWQQYIFPEMCVRGSPLDQEGQGRVFSRSGSSLPIVKIENAVTGEPAGWKLRHRNWVDAVLDVVDPTILCGDIASGYAGAEVFAYLRCKAADWADACGVAAGLIRKGLA